MTNNIRLYKDGFTIVELLIVIVIIGILAAISVVAYTTVQNKAHDSIVRQDFANIHKNLEMVKAELGHYPLTRNQFPANLKVTRNSYSTSANHTNYAADPEGKTYAFGSVSRSGLRFLMTNSGEISEGVPADAANVARAIGLTWGGDTVRIQGYTSSGGWIANWSLVQS